MKTEMEKCLAGEWYDCYGIRSHLQPYIEERIYP